MNKKPLSNASFFFLFFVFLTACKGQTKNQETLLPSPTRSNTLGQVKTLIHKSSNQFSSVSCAFEDKNNKIWFGTREGVYCYDGRSFLQFTTQDSLNSNDIYSILEDTDGNIWFGTDYGVCRYDGKTIKNMPMLSHHALLGSALMPQSANLKKYNRVWSMMQDKSGTIWFGTDDGVYCYQKERFTLFLDNKNILNKDNVELKAIFSMLQEDNGAILLASCIGEGLIRFDGKTIEKISKTKYARTEGLKRDKNGTIWFASGGKGLCKYDGNTITTNVINEPDVRGVLYLFVIDNNDHFWLWDFYNRPMSYYDGKTLVNFAEHHVIFDKKMRPLLADHSGNIWFGGDGMHLFKWDGKDFTGFSE